MFYFFVWFLPYQYVITDVIFRKAFLLTVIKDFMIITMFVFAVLDLLITSKRILINKNDFFVLCSLMIILVLGIGTSNNFQVLNIARIYAIPIILYFIMKMSNLKLSEVVIVVKILFINTFIISIYGIFQALVLKDQFLIKIDFLNTGLNYLHHSFYIGGYFGFQRINGTFVSPNDFAFYLMCMILCVLFFYKFYPQFKPKMYSLGIFIFFVALIGTFSRTAWMGTFVALFIFFASDIFDLRKMNKLIKFIVIGAVFLICFLLIDSLLLESRFFNMILHLLENTFSKKDLSLIGHSDSMKQSIELLINHPFGLGFGNNGPRALAYMFDANLTESSYFLMSYDLGIFGGVLYFLPFYICLLDGSILKKSVNKKFLVIPIFGALLGFILLPFTQNYEVMCYLYIFLGIFYSKNLGDE